MDYRKFARYNVIGALLWVVSLTVLGYLIGNLPWVRKNFSWVALALIVVPALPALVEFSRHVLPRTGKRRT
jgi:membrane-associated protein